MTVAAAARRATIRWRAAACVLAVLATLTRPAAAAAPQRVVVADLRGVTTITWSGVAAIRLRVPKDVHLPESAYRFTVRTGRYVSVRAFENPQPIGCRRDFHQDWCAGIFLDWLRDLAETSGHGVNTTDPAHDFLSTLNDPPIVRRGGWDLYLFTDRTATIQITAPGLTGRAGYVAGGRFAGQATQAPAPCRLATCPAGDPVYADQRIGGSSFDVGRAGFVHALAYGGIPNRPSVPGVGSDQSFLLRTCQYPNANAPDASPDPAAHPEACDRVPPSSPKDTALGTVNELGSAGPASMRAIYGAGEYQASGRVYLGFRATSVGPVRPRVGGLLVWLRYGIR